MSGELVSALLALLVGVMFSLEAFEIPPFKLRKYFKNNPEYLKFFRLLSLIILLGGLLKLYFYFS